MAKEINEKTFELNITNELLNISKSFIWYLDHYHWFPFPISRNRNVLRRFFNQSTIFAEGLTQEEESNPKTGGYDVSINYHHPNGQEGRLMFLQYKAGIRKTYSKNKKSIFHGPTARKAGKSSEHIMFTFNDAAYGTQHSTLRRLANTKDISPNSVLYVFPRITDKDVFKREAGNLISNSSFVPVLEIDKQGSKQTPKITIKDGVSHKYRTSFDGKTSEINLLLLLFLYDDNIISELISELICIQIERFANILNEEDGQLVNIFLDALSDDINRFIQYELNNYPSKEIISQKIKKYINAFRESNRTIPRAPSKFTTIVPNEGLRIKFEGETDYSAINYQLF